MGHILIINQIHAGYAGFFLDKKTKIKYQKHLQENDTLVTFNSPRSHFHGEYYEDNNRCRKN